MTDSPAWLRRFHPAAAGAPRLVCFPHAGGAASYFHPLSATLAPAVDVLAVQYPGRPGPARRTAGGRPVPARRPAGGRPRRRGCRAGGVLRAQHGRQPGLRGRAAARAAGRAAGLVRVRRAAHRRRPATGRVHERGDDELLAEVRQLGGTDVRVLEHPQLVRMVLPVLRNDYKAAETYRYRPGPDVGCPVFALIGDRDPKVTEAEARRVGGAHVRPLRAEVVPGRPLLPGRPRCGGQPAAGRAARRSGR